MASNYTDNYKLCQWEAEDRVLRTEFNEDNAKIDAALVSLSSAVSGKASSSAVSSLQSLLNSLKTTVSQQTATLSGKGNCQIYATTYVGTGRYGSDAPCSVSFPLKPMVVFVTGPDSYQGIFTQGSSGHYAAYLGVSGSYVAVTWGSKSVTWYSDKAASLQLNTAGKTYTVTALLKAD